ncbi:hypothetical protein Baya_15718 [Bagarius yarrelli]|uniref:Uncharacterized protein n=1 Tax=Bagarius yarrelli TaxID=175774 RepID=A0A556VCQ8_BAGYA|nr:hypothetical protein Baya_15718 [Bagarius yarrelli]
MIQYFDFIQSHIQNLHSSLPLHCLPETNRGGSDSESEDTARSEPSTPPRILKAKRKYSFGRLRKKDILNLGNTTDQESPCQGSGSQCSICDDRTGSESGSQGSNELGSPSSGSFILKDQMFGVPLPLGENQLDDSPRLPQTPLLPFLPLLGFQEGLNLSPSLLTSPARGLSHTLLPEGQEELQMLFEDVWVPPKPAGLKQCRQGNDDYAFSQSEERDKGSDDLTWIPNQRLYVKKGSKNGSRKDQTVSGPRQKKKCVNGFIMFCRLNRRLYLSLKARQYSRQHNRNVRSEGQSAEEEEEDCVPSPLHILLAHRHLWFTSSEKA